MNIASAMAAQNRLDDAIEVVTEAMGFLVRSEGPEHERTLEVEKRLAELQVQSEKHKKAE